MLLAFLFSFFSLVQRLTGTCTTRNRLQSTCRGSKASRSLFGNLTASKYGKPGQGNHKVRGKWKEKSSKYGNQIWFSWRWIRFGHMSPMQSPEQMDRFRSLWPRGMVRAKSRFASRTSSLQKLSGLGVTDEATRGLQGPPKKGEAGRGSVSDGTVCPPLPHSPSLGSMIMGDPFGNTYGPRQMEQNQSKPGYDLDIAGAASAARPAKRLKCL